MVSCGLASVLDSALLWLSSAVVAANELQLLAPVSISLICTSSSVKTTPYFMFWGVVCMSSGLVYKATYKLLFLDMSTFIVSQSYYVVLSVLIMLSNIRRG